MSFNHMRSNYDQANQSNQERLAAAEQLQDQLDSLASGVEVAASAYARLCGPGGRDQFKPIVSSLSEITAEVDRLVGTLHRYVRQGITT
jgi:hypothetical protein